MGLRQAVSEWVEIVKDAFGFGPEFPAAMAARRLELAQELPRLKQLLEEAQETCRQKDKLIAKLQAADAVKADMVADESAYYIKKENVLDGPFCMSCFQRNHEMTRIALSPKPPGADNRSADWVQCVKCRIPFRSDRISRYLNPGKTAPAQTPVSPEGTGRPAPVKASPKPRTRRPEKSPSEQPESAPTKTPKSATPPIRRSATSGKKPAGNTTSPMAAPKSSGDSPPGSATSGPMAASDPW